MRVNGISVKGLFGMFDHVIPLQNAERVTIIIGPNGFGKTMMLRMIAALVEGTTSILEHTPFTEICFTLEDGTARIIRREEHRYKENRPLADELHNHRVHVLRDEARFTQVAYGYLCGKPYRVIEKTAKSAPDWIKVERMVMRYGESESCFGFKKWLASIDVPAEELPVAVAV